MVAIATYRGFQTGLARGLHPDLLTDSKQTTNLTVFWHIGVLTGREERLEQILRRQFFVVKDSGLASEAQIKIGLVVNRRTWCNRVFSIAYCTGSPTLNRILDHGHTELVAAEVVADECTTTKPLWKYAQQHASSKNNEGLVLYFHSRGVSRDPETPGEEWTKTMEYFTIRHWRHVTRTMADNLSLMTAGCEPWPHEKRQADFPGLVRPNADEVWHYSGNFWWARASYVAALPDPAALAVSSMLAVVC
jgi:hypothetical protein